MGKKAQETSMGTIIWIIIALIVVALIIAFLFFGNILWDYFKNLPGYKYNNKDRVVDNITKDEKTLINYYMVGVIPDSKHIKFCTAGDCSDGKLRDSNLYWSGNERDAKIYVHRDWKWNVWTDVWVGNVVNNRIWIDAGVLDGKGDIYEKTKDYLPSNNDLLNFENSIYISGIIYRDKEVK